jgi:hypothetical protein
LKVLRAGPWNAYSATAVKMLPVNPKKLLDSLGKSKSFECCCFDLFYLLESIHNFLSKRVYVDEEEASTKGILIAGLCFGFTAQLSGTNIVHKALDRSCLCG